MEIKNRFTARDNHVAKLAQVVCIYSMVLVRGKTKEQRGAKENGEWKRGERLLSFKAIDIEVIFTKYKCEKEKKQPLRALRC